MKNYEFLKITKINKLKNCKKAYFLKFYLQIQKVKPLLRISS